MNCLTPLTPKKGLFLSILALLSGALVTDTVDLPTVANILLWIGGIGVVVSLIGIAVMADGDSGIE